MQTKEILAQVKTRLAKSKGYLDKRCFHLSHDLMRLRNATTLVNNALDDIKKIEQKINILDYHNKVLLDIINQSPKKRTKQIGGKK